MTLENFDRSFIEAFLRHSGAMKFIVAAGGKIVWANDAFVRWIGYSEGELKRIPLRELSIRDELQEDDFASANKQDRYNPIFTLQQQMRPRNDRPVWGCLTIMRFPPDGDVNLCGYTWEPTQEGTEKAFALAMENSAEMKLQMAAVTNAVVKLTTLTDEESLALAAIRLMLKHPKVTLFIITWTIGLANVSSLIGIAKDTAVVPEPAPRVEQVQRQQQPEKDKE